MAMEQRWLLGLLVGFVCVGLVWGDAGVVETADEVKGDKVGPLIKEIERLKAQVGTLDSNLEKKEAHISVLEQELSVLKEQQKDGETLSKLEKDLDSTSLKVRELEEQVATATKQSEQAHKYAEAEKKRAESAEESVRDLTAKYEKSQEAFLASKKHAAVVEKTLKNAEIDIVEAEKKLKAHGEELSRVHKSWLPPWAASHVSVLKTRASSKWSSHAKPQVDALYRHASLKAGEAHAFVRPHFDNFASKAGPAVKEQWKKVSDSVSPHVELLRSKTNRGFEVVRTEYVGKAQQFLQPYFKTLGETTTPYVTLIQERTRPYVDQVSTASKPYVENARKFVNPYIEKASPYYRDAVSGALKHHENLQGVLRENVSKSELLKSFITNEVVWFLASAVLALPVFAAFLVLSSTFGRKKKPTPKHKRASPAGSTASSGVTADPPKSESKPKRSKKADK